MVRIVLSAIISFAVVVGLFLLMNGLISNVSETEEVAVITTDLGFVEEEKKVQNKERRVPKKPPPPKEPPPPEQPKPEQQQKVVTALVNIEIADIDSSLDGTGISIGGLGAKADFSGFGDGEAIPLFTPPAAYPVQANLKGIEGYVRFQFDIEPDGSPSNLRVLEEKPRGVFKKEARRAIRKWKFKPRIVNGISIKQTNMRYTMKFELDN